ncbi:MAG: Ig-like domain-containing protein [Candidatus Omnitrophica bacterium]|nr:Ig-like domain-containing protein [Candidatus Omnitrophota bacterium]
MDKRYKSGVWFMLVLLFCGFNVCFGQDIIISVRFPEKSTGRNSGVSAIQKAEIVSGKVTLDFSPRPSGLEEQRYLVEYYLDSELLYKTNGIIKAGSEQADFRYELDTTKYNNGEYNLYVNFWDKNGASAIGSRKIIINNEKE